MISKPLVVQHAEGNNVVQQGKKAAMIYKPPFQATCWWCWWVAVIAKLHCSVPPPHLVSSAPRVQYAPLPPCELCPHMLLPGGARTP